MPACDAATLEAGSRDLARMSDRELMMALVFLLCLQASMQCNAQALINASYANGLAKMSDRDLREAMVNLLCQGGGSGNVTFGISQGAVAPTAAPAQPNWLYYADVNHTDNPGVWLWNSTTNKWDEIIAPG